MKLIDLFCKCKTIAILAFLLLNYSNVNAQFYTGMHHPFGKNRIQYEQFDWQKFEFEDYTVFFYGKGRNLAEFTSLEAKSIIDEMERFFDYPLRSQKIQFVVYEKLEHFRQSNVGIPESGEANVGGITQIAGNKVFLYYTGDFNEFRKQIRKGIADVLMAQMLFGDNWREVIKNTALLSFPVWYVEGLKQYATEAWSVEADDRLRDMILRDDYEKFNRLKGSEAEIAGRSLWYYVSQTYGSNVIPNILYMSRISRNVESGFLYVLGISFNTLLNDAKLYFQYRYETDIEGAQPFGDYSLVRTSKRRDYTRPQLSLDGQYLAYSSNTMGRTRLHIKKLNGKRTKTTLRSGYKLDRVYDEAYPVIDWNPATGELAAVTEKRGHIFLYQIDPKKPRKKTKIELLRLEKVLDMNYAADGKSIVMSAINLGQSDIYLYSVAANNAKKLTNDVFDDLNPSFWNGDQIIFSSNRTSTKIEEARKILSNQPSPHLDLFSIPVKGAIEAQRLTDTPLADETSPLHYGNNEFTYISDESGIKNRYRGYLDSSIVSIDTLINYRYFTKSEALSAYPRGIDEMDFLEQESVLVEHVFYEGKDRFIIKRDEDATAQYEPLSSNYRQLLELPPLKPEPEKEIITDSSGIKLIRVKVFEDQPEIKTDNGLVDIYDYKFDEITESAAKDIPLAPKSTNYQQKIDSLKAISVDNFSIPEQRNYNIAFAATDFTAQFDFDYATQGYQLFNGGPYINAGIGPFVKLGMLDVFEDYKLEGGFRYQFNSQGTEYFLTLSNRAKRLDKKYIVQRQAMEVDLPNFKIGKNETYQITGQFRYPLDEVNALQLTGTGRYDRQITLARTTSDLLESDKTRFWGGAKLEYIFDNSIPRALNILNGVRAKTWVEHLREMNDPAQHTTIFGVDARHYLPIYRDVIWANRLASSSSIGTQKLIYYMGGVDDWIILNNNDPSPRFDQTTNIATDANYYFQTIATNMRGFKQSARNGNSFAVLNSEIRWPIVRFFTDKPLKNEFFANLQVIGFGDVGTAWNGPNPYSDENAFNNIVVTNGSATVTYKNQNDPIIGSVGWGVRTKLWGYFVRYDYAYPIENGQFLEPRAHLSIGLDF